MTARDCDLVRLRVIILVSTSTFKGLPFDIVAVLSDDSCYFGNSSTAFSCFLANYLRLRVGDFEGLLSCSCIDFLGSVLLFTNWLYLWPEELVASFWRTLAGVCRPFCILASVLVPLCSSRESLRFSMEDMELMRVSPGSSGDLIYSTLGEYIFSGTEALGWTGDLIG